MFIVAALAMGIGFALVNNARPNTNTQWIGFILSFSGIAAFVLWLFL